MSARTLHLNIDRIVVEGLSPSQQRRFASALKQRLQTLAESGIADQFTHNTRRRIAALNAGQLRSGATAAQAAEQVAASIVNSITNRPSATAQPRPANSEVRRHA